MNDVFTLRTNDTPLLDEMRRRVLQWKFEVRALVARRPSLAPLYRLVVWWTQYKVRHHIDVRECRVGPDTEFVLDGFQGSGNTFATVAFKESQLRPVRIAHHLHAPAQIIKAVRLEKPTLVTLRPPRDAVLSLVSRWPYITTPQALRAYAHFYETIEPYAHGYVLSPFDQTTGHLDRVIQAVNRRFETDFDLFDHTDENVRSIRGSGASQKNPRRSAIKAERARAIDDGTAGDLLQRAEAVHGRLLPRTIGH